MRIDLRRELTFWTDWRPWLGLGGIVCLTGGLLSEKMLGLASYLSSYQLGMGLPERRTSDMLFLVALLLAFCMWSWLAGFVLGSLSGRTIWLTCPLLYLAVNNFYLLRIGSIRLGLPHAPSFPQFIFDMVFPRVDETFLVFALPALWGALQGCRGPAFSFANAITMALLVTALTALLSLAGTTYGLPAGAWRTPIPTFPWQLAVIMWPTAYILATSRRRIL